MPRLEGWPAPRCSQCEKQECTCKVNTMEVATGNTMEATTANTKEATTAKVVVRLTLELSPTHAAELVELMARHVDWEDFPWAETIYDAFNPVDSHRKVMFTDIKFGTNVYLRRKKD